MLAVRLKSIAYKGALLGALPLLLNACADDISGPVSSYEAKGPVNGAECNLYRADTNALLAGPGTTVNGEVDYGEVAYSGVGYVRCTGGTYTDEATGNTYNAPDLRAAKTFTGGTRFILTPITEIAVRKAESASGGLVSNADSFNDSVAAEFGLGAIDITAVTPTDLSTAAAQDNAEGWYGTALAGISQYMADNGKTASGAMDDFVAAANMASSGLETALANIATNTDPDSNLSTNDNLPVTQAIIGGLGSGADGTPGRASNESGTSPTVSNISPSTVSPAGGTVLTITGTGFVDGNLLAATVGGQAAQVSFVSPTQITITTPSVSTTGPVNLVITNGDGGTVTVPNAFTYSNETPPPPVIGNISSTTGSEAGGSVLTITGTGFVNGDSLAVTIGGQPAQVSFDSETQITVTTPAASSTGPVDIVITNGDGGSVTMANAFTYNSACQDCELDANSCPF